MEMPPPLQPDQPAVYRLALQGRVQAEWSDWLRDVSVHTQPGTPEQPAVTVLTGTVADQAALFGLLAHVRDLGLPLLLVQHLGAGQPASTSTVRSPA